MSRVCPECGNSHNTVIEDTRTGEIIERLDKCRGCFLGFGPKGTMKDRPCIKEQILLNEEPKDDPM